jgi:PhoD-like phosphatase
VAELLLGPMLRYVSSTSATVWVETDQACVVEVCGANQKTFSFAGHHYALVVIEGLEPGSVTTYTVTLDGQQRWPLPDSDLPPSCIRTHAPGSPVTVMFGSCRAAAPHEPPYTLELDHDVRGRGVDALHVAGLRMLQQQPHEWPQLLLFLGDQVYADESSPLTAERVERKRDGPDDPPKGIVANFEEYTWLYHEAWTPEIERWVLSVVPSAMIFDDHDVIDDWNISDTWVTDIRAEPWWPEHIIGGLVSYWIYQHLGNLSPERVADEGLVDQITAVSDATDLLRHWALESEEFTPLPGGYQFSFDRHFGTVHVIVIDSRNGRVLEPGKREMVDRDEWAWIVDQAREQTDHLILATSLPLFVPGGLHGIEQWSEAACDGARWKWLRRGGERLRRALDLEDWAAFDRSFRRFEQLLIGLCAPGDGRDPPATVSILSGDIHFAYVAEIVMPSEVTTRVRQIVCSPIRNTLRTRERRVMSFVSSRFGRRLGKALMRRADRPASALSWELSTDAVFHNNVGTLRFEQQDAHLLIEVAVSADGCEQHLETAITQ